MASTLAEELRELALERLQRWQKREDQTEWIAADRIERLEVALRGIVVNAECMLYAEIVDLDWIIREAKEALTPAS